MSGTKFIQHLFLFVIFVSIPAFSVFAVLQMRPILEIPTHQVAGLATEFSILDYKNMLEGADFTHKEVQRTITYTIEPTSMPKGLSSEILGSLSSDAPNLLNVSNQIIGYLPDTGLSIGLSYGGVIYWIYESGKGSNDTSIYISEPGELQLVYKTDERINYPLKINLEFQY